MDINTGMNY